MLNSFFPPPSSQLLDRSPGNPVDEGMQATVHRQDEKLKQGGKRHELADVPTNEASQHSKWEKILQHVSMNLLYIIHFKCLTLVN
jgi:hypothetical protein